MKGLRRLARGCLFTIKSEGRDKSFLFWAFAYPLILAVFFKMAFGGVLDMDMEKIRAGIEENNPYRFIIEQIDVIEMQIVDETEGKEAVLRGELDGFINREGGLTVAKSGASQTLLKEILDYILQVYEMGLPYEKFDFEREYVRSVEQKEEVMSVIFYSLIGMCALFGIHSGIEATYHFQGNLSSLGARVQATPIRKYDMVLSAFLVGTLLNLVCNIVLLLFMRYVLGLHLFTDIGRSMVVIGVSNVLGVAMGIFVSASNKMDIGKKSLMAVILNLVLSFTAGMIGADLKLFLQENFPIWSYLNPISIVTDNMYRLNLLSDVRHYGLAIAVLLAETVVFLGLSYIFLRREQYDSL